MQDSMREPELVEWMPLLRCLKLVDQKLMDCLELVDLVDEGLLGGVDAERFSNLYEDLLLTLKGVREFRE